MNGHVKTHKVLFASIPALALAGLVGAGTLSTSALEKSLSKDVSVGIDPVLSITAPESLSLNITPSATDPALQTISGIVTVGTNNITGYTLYMSMDNTTTNALVNQSKPTLTIPSLAAETTIANFPVNQWGYAKEASNAITSFLPLPAIGSSETLKTTEGPASASNTDVTFGTKVDMTVTAGNYSNVAKFTAVTNELPPEVITFDKAYQQAGKSKATASDGQQYYQMKDMTKDICSAVTPAASTAAADTQTGTLVDTRDGKTYQVAKLLDGNCWMTENLRLGSGTQSYNLTSADSNVSSDWTLPAMPTSTSWTATYTEPMLYPSDEQDTTSSGYHGYYGYYYNWNAATAGTGNNTQMEAQYDICPKGWSLPSNYTVNSDRSYSKLLYSHGVISDIAGSGYATDGYTKMTTAPLQFVLSGRHGESGTSVGVRGSYGNYWSSSSSGTTNAYYLNFSSSFVIPQLSLYNKDYGYVVRCLALDSNNPTPTPDPVDPDNPGGGGESNGGGGLFSSGNPGGSVFGSSSSGSTDGAESSDGYVPPKGVFNTTSESSPNWFLIICLSIFSLLLIVLIIYLIHRLRKESKKDQPLSA